jgi:hypothetical protein
MAMQCASFAQKVVWSGIRAVHISYLTPKGVHKFQPRVRTLGRQMPFKTWKTPKELVNCYRVRDLNYLITQGMKPWA